MKIARKSVANARVQENEVYSSFPNKLAVKIIFISETPVSYRYTAYGSTSEADFNYEEAALQSGRIIVDIIGLLANQESSVDIWFRDESGEESLFSYIFDTTDIDYGDARIHIDYTVHDEEVVQATLGTGWLITNYYNAYDINGDLRLTGMYRWINSNMKSHGSSIFVGDEINVLYYAEKLHEVNLLGEIKKTFTPPEGYAFHHDITFDTRGHIYILGSPLAEARQDAMREGILYCYDYKTAEFLWSRDYSPEFQNQYVLANSEIYDIHFNSLQYIEQANQIIINSRNTSAFIGVDADTGDLIWQVNNPASTVLDTVNLEILNPDVFEYPNGQHAVLLTNNTKYDDHRTDDKIVVVCFDNKSSMNDDGTDNLKPIGEPIVPDWYGAPFPSVTAIYCIDLTNLTLETLDMFYIEGQRSPYTSWTVDINNYFNSFYGDPSNYFIFDTDNNVALEVYSVEEEDAYRARIFTYDELRTLLSNRISTEPRPAVNQGTDENNQTVLRHTAIYNSLLSHVTENQSYVALAVNPYGTAPLSGYLGVWAFNENPIRVQVNDDIESIPVDYTYTPEIGANLVPLLGLAPDAANQVLVTIPGVGTATTAILTGPLPPTDAESSGDPGFPIYELTVSAAAPSETIGELYFTAFAERYNAGVDYNGVVRWYTTLDIPAFNFERIANGHFLSTASRFNDAKHIYEFDLVGRIHKVYVLDNRCHHSIYEMADGNLLLTSENTGTTDEDGLSIIDVNTGLELAYYDMRNVLDVNRVPIPSSATDIDWLHINQSYLNTTNNLIVTSGRAQGIFAVDADTSRLAFILANHEDWNSYYRPYLLTPVDENGTALYDLSDADDIDKADKEFWPWGHHAVLEVPDTTLGIVEFFAFDNGNFRSRNVEKAILPDNNYSRIVRYRVDVNNMTVMKIFEYGETEVGNRGYSSFVSNEAVLENGNYFINFGGGMVDENGRRTTRLPGITDIEDPLVGDMTQGIVLLQEIDPETKAVQVEFTATSGVLVDGRDEFYSFRSHKLPLLPLSDA